MDWNKYINHITAEGKTKRDRQINRLKNQINNKVGSNPSYKSVKLNGEETHLIINTGTQPYYKEFQSLPDQEINIGDYIEWANSYWLVMTCDYDDEVYRDGKLYQCNYLLKWQNEKGEIIERWAVILSASKYNDGTEGNNYITLGSDQLSIAIPLDEESLKLKKSMSKKFFIDNNKDNPTAYELTGTGNVPDTYNGHGVTSWIVKECAYSPTEDDLKYGVCNYVDYSSSTPSEPTTPDETEDLWYMELEYSTLKIKPLDKDYSIVAHLYDNNDTEITDGIEYEWTIESNIGSYLAVKKNSNTLTLSLSSDCEDYGEKVTISCMNKYTGQSAQIELEVTEVY